MSTTNGSFKCLKPQRNYRVYPHTPKASVSVSNPNLRNLPESETPPWASSYRNSFHNLSKRFKSKNKIKQGTNSSESPSLSSCKSRLKDPKIFASNPALNDESSSEVVSNSPGEVLKSCLKKLPRRTKLSTSASSLSVVDKFLCENNNNNEGDIAPTRGTNLGFKKFLAVVTVALCYAGLILLSISNVPSVNAGLGDYDIQGIWGELTKDEILSIFGRHHHPHYSSSVPNSIAIIQPTTTTTSHENLKRRKRSNPSSRDDTIIQLQGLGRKFTLFLNPNRNLVDSDFVFLKRRDNQSEILPETHNTNLDCFYHGVAEHFGIDDGNNTIEDDPIGGRIALNTCGGGLKGLIISTFNEPDGTTTDDDPHNYVIHPIPPRFHPKQFKRRDEEQPHFLFPLINPLKPSQSSCGHDHDDHRGPLKRKRRSPDDMFESYWSHHDQLRSSLFHQPPSSSAFFPASYWNQKSSSSETTPGQTGASNIGFTFQRRNYYEGEGEGPSGTSSTWFSRNPRILRYDEGEDVEGEEETEPDTILPFYTKGRRKPHSTFRNPPTYSSSELNSRDLSYSTSDSWLRYRESGGGVGDSRKGRRDEGFFGRDWKSRLDNEPSATFAEKKGRFRSSEEERDVENSIYASRELNKGPSSVPPSHLTIETAVFVDKDLYAHMQSNFPSDTHGEVVRIVLAMINAVQLLYQDPSLGHRVDFVLKRLEILEADPPGLIRPYDIDRFLTNFCKWQKGENPVSDADPLHWDHALILTGLDLYVVHQSGKISNQVVGLAPVAGMCTKSSSCTVNEGRHFESVFVISHEIGHNLGMRHDGPQADNECDPTSHIMSPTLGSGKITWSPCSRKYLDMFLETSQSKCLLDKGKSEIRLDHEKDGRLPGERFDSDRQCLLKYGRGSFHASQQPLEDVCRDLHCRREHYTWTSHPALEGTYCGVDMWCRAGKCVRKSSSSYYSPSLNNNHEDNQVALIGSNSLLRDGETAAYSVQKAIDGAWGAWSLFTDCSSACLHSDDGVLSKGSTGVRLAARRCDSPRPENGGRQCTGPDRRYKTCPSSKVSKVCGPTNNFGKRTTISQYAHDVCARAAAADTDLTGIGFMMSTNDAERACSVWCETVDNGVPRSRGWSFPDGTACKLISSSTSPVDKERHYCVAGKCQEFTCNPYSHYALSDEECTLFPTSNEVVEEHEEHPPKSSWFTNKKSSTLSSESLAVPRGGGVGVDGWTEWEPHSECQLPCLAPAKGLQIVKRRCLEDLGASSPCAGLGLSVRLCKPDKSTILRNGCTRLQTPFEYATKVCTKYGLKIPGLSGIGMQLAPTKEDKDRPCRIGCQDISLPYRFYMVNGEDGWFPAGTDCSRGDPDKKAFCVGGKCVDFGPDDTPLYRSITPKVLGRLESLFPSSRIKREATYNIMEPLRVHPSIDEHSLREIVHQYSKQTGNFPSISAASKPSSVDFSRPILTNYPSSRRLYGSSFEQSTFSARSGHFPSSGPMNNNNNYYDNPRNARKNGKMNMKMNNGFGLSSGENMRQDETVLRNQGTLLLNNDVPIEGSYYEWRKIVSDCSVSCGKGIQEIIVECVSGDVVVSANFCAHRPPPGYSGYVDCHRTMCSSARKSSGDEGLGGGHIWNWLQSVLSKDNNKSRTRL